MANALGFILDAHGTSNSLEVVLGFKTTQGLSRKDPGLISDVCLSEGGRQEFTEILHPWSSKSFPCFNTSFQVLRTEAETKQGSIHLVKYYPDNVWSQE